MSDKTFRALDTTTPSPLLSRLEPDTPYITRAVKVNGNYLLCKSCEVFPHQVVDQIFLVQGGPRGAIGNIGMKKIEGQIVFPLLVQRNGTLDPAILAILANAESPFNTIALDTNHVYSHVLLTADDGGTDNNALLTLDNLVIQKLTISVPNEQEAVVTASFIGRVTAREASDWTTAPPNTQERRRIGWNDCKLSRFQSSMRNALGFELNLTNNIEHAAFITSALAPVRDDQLSILGASRTQWGGKFEEFIRRGADIETYIHGGFMPEENLTIDFGAFIATVTTPLFGVGEQSLSQNYKKRTTNFWASVNPSVTSLLFTYP